MSWDQADAFVTLGLAKKATHVWDKGNPTLLSLQKVTPVPEKSLKNTERSLSFA